MPALQTHLLHQNIKLLSFDLDNALYDNRPVLAAAEDISAQYLKAQFEKQQQKFCFDDFIQIRHQLLARGDRRYEDLSFFRQQALNLFCQRLNSAEVIAAKAFDLFIQKRSLADIPVAISTMLQQFSQEYILVSVTNGNCDASRLSISDFFTKNYSASNGVRAKPHPQMLQQVLRDFNLSPQQVIHIGDSVTKDGAAAQAAGTGFYHFSPFEKAGMVEISCNQLTAFLAAKKSGCSG